MMPDDEYRPRLLGLSPLICKNVISCCRPSSSTYFFGVARAGRYSLRRFKPYESSSFVVFTLFSRSTSCTRSQGPEFWRCARYKTSSRPWTFVRRAGLRSCRTWTSPDVLVFSLAAGCTAEYAIVTPSRSRPSDTLIPTACDALEKPRSQ